MSNEGIARVCHEVNRAYCEATGDNSQPTWAEAPEWQRSSACVGVQGVIDGNGPEESHISWLKQKEDDGWVYGAVKDPDAKTHPCIVSYDRLPDSQKVKDHLFVTVVSSLTATTPKGA